MKIRIKDNSIRLRLTQKEVARFGETGLALATTQFTAGNSFTYALQSSTTTEAIDATFERNRITIHVPKTIAKQWTSTDEVGFDRTVFFAVLKFLFAAQHFTVVVKPPQSLLLLSFIQALGHLFAVGVKELSIRRLAAFLIA